MDWRKKILNTMGCPNPAGPLPYNIHGFISSMSAVYEEYKQSHENFLNGRRVDGPFWEFFQKGHVYDFPTPFEFLAFYLELGRKHFPVYDWEKIGEAIREGRRIEILQNLKKYLLSPELLKDLPEEYQYLVLLD